MNKEISKRLFSLAGIPLAEGFSLNKSERNTCKDKPVFPCVVKPACGGSSIGVSIARNENEYEAALDDAFKWEDFLLVEQFIEGREFSCGVLGDRVLPVIEIAPKEGFYDYKNKYKSGSAVETCPAELPEEITAAIQSYALKAMECLGLNVYARMDFMLDRATNKVYCLEANTLPGMTPTSLLPQEAAAVGIDFESLCEKIIELSLARFC